MSQLLEMLGKGLVKNLWCVFGPRLAEFEGNLEALNVRLVECPDDPDLRIAAAVTSFRQGLYDQALAHARRLDALENGPYHVQGPIIQACTLEAIGKRSDTIDLLVRLNEDFGPTDSAVLFAIGVLCETTGQTERAIEYYLRAIEVSPTLTNAHQRLAAIYVTRDERDRAIE